MRDLVLNGSFGRGTTIATLLPHHIRPPASRVRQRGRSLAILDAVDSAFVGLFGNQIETELLADNASKKAAHGMRLPFRCRHDSGNRRPAGVRSIARMRACLVSGRVGSLVMRVLTAARLGFAGRSCGRAGRALGLDLGLVMGSSEVVRRHPPHHLSPAGQISRRGRDPEARLGRPSRHSNAPIKPESQSILSK